MAVGVGLLAGCGVIVPGTPWHAFENYKGPLIVGGSRAAMEQRCAALDTFMGRGPCELAFIDDQGHRVIWRDVQEKVDAQLGELEATKPYVGRDRGNGSYALPYRPKGPNVLQHRL